MEPSSKDEREGIRLVLLDDHQLFRESLARLLSAEQDLKIVGQCANSADALKFLKASGVDIVLVDLDIAKEFILFARKGRSQGKFLVVTLPLSFGSAPPAFSSNRTPLPV
jgi:DNA-binding NarL/FixJ family response regulator